jgi:hypothetical protein
MLGPEGLLGHLSPHPGLVSRSDRGIGRHPVAALSAAMRLATSTRNGKVHGVCRPWLREVCLARRIGVVTAQPAGHSVGDCKPLSIGGYGQSSDEAGGPTGRVSGAGAGRRSVVVREPDVTGGQKGSCRGVTASETPPSAPPSNARRRRFAGDDRRILGGIRGRAMVRWGNQSPRGGPASPANCTGSQRQARG